MDSKKCLNSEDFDHIYRDEDFSDVEKIIKKHRKEREPFLDSLEELIRESSSQFPLVLEVGCGTAVDLYSVANNTTCQPFGLDLSGEALTVASGVGKRFSKKALLVRGDLLFLPFADESLDLVFSQGVMEHLSNDETALKEKIRVLKPGGNIVISVPQKYTAYTVIKHLKMVLGKWPWGYETEYSYRKLKSLGDHLGLIEKNVIGYGYWLHPLEPVWVIRSLFFKIQRINPLRKLSFFMKLSKWYEDLWIWIEKRFGHQFMRDIAIIFEK